MTAVASRRWKAIAVAGFAALAVAVLGGLMTDLSGWYQDLRKPSWQPPGYLFAPAWTLIFALVALSAATAWQVATDRRTREWILILFISNGFLNVLWSLLFFRLRRPDWALIEVVALWISILWMILFLRRHSNLAAWLLVPYLAWVSFAGFLNYTVVQLNAPF